MRTHPGGNKRSRPILREGVGEMKKNITKIVILAVAALLLVILVADCFATVPVGSTGILLTFGKVEEGKALS